MIRKAIIKKNINTSEIHHVVGHNGSVFFKILFKYFCYLAVLLLIFLLLDRYLTRQYLSRVFAGLWLILFVKFCMDFADIYLDCIVMTDTWITLYLREWLLEYKTDHFDWDSIETISFNQKWFRDRLFMKWDITITLDHGIEYPFEDISNPKKQVDKILQLKGRFTVPVPEEDKELEWKKFDILVEALWEVVKDYIDKDNDNYSY
jgi:hypothetical protein